MKLFNTTIFSSLLLLSLFSCNNDDDTNTTIPDDNVDSKIITAELTGQLSHEVYVDLNTGETVTSEVNTWEVAFDQNGTIISNSGKKVALAMPVETDFDAINEESAQGLQLYYDDESADKTLTAWNKNGFELNTPYILDLGIDGLGKSLGFKKFIISENSSSQAVIKFADLNGENEQTTTVEKGSGFVYFSMIENKVNEVEPANWDIVLKPVTVRTGAPCFTMGDAAMPGINCDIMRLNASVIINQNGSVKGAKTSNYPDLEPNDDPEHEINLLTIEDSNFEEITPSTVGDLEMTTQGNLIGKEWFHIQTPHRDGVYKVYSHITFVVNDEEGNNYKLRFLTYSKDGQNGYPTFEYQLIQDN
ncbi:HmuY family protein [Flammeovirga yaeyamensis]|uniref:HmuY family protein n=1 Tax=Flammeovirga yaeyamensis TaxID=367791 RepID=A0AAX1N9E7_9BACT|nr:HmuY family protein [Flammeovirga yaeyamensis]MBB3701279.1 hypothetical protein [Flammeovirga yaeyamensis]NMF38251.1 hypothetical protein [Flammeovirga yaeyamensis]QWG02662.1 HmuY family protein [Flammeovirga yaeyamensis]